MTTILVVATHPDDEVLGCGGVMARHADMGDHVHVLVVTRGIEAIFPAEEIEGTRRELARAHEILRVTSTTFLDFPAPDLDVTRNREIADAIRFHVNRLGAHTVYFPHRGDLHADHRAVYLATLVATRPINASPVRRLLCYETLSETEWGPPSGADAFVPTVFVDISTYLQLKLDAMACYQSQLKAPPHSRSLNALDALARFRGNTVSIHAAEAFMLVREIEE